MPDETVYSSRPAVRFAGRDHSIVTDNLLSLAVHEQEGGLSSLELRLSNVHSNEQGDADLAFPDDEIVQLGGEVEVAFGDEQDPVSLFIGVVTAIEEVHGDGGPPELVVLAEDPLQGARMQRRSAVHDDRSMQQLAEGVAERLGLSVTVDGLQAAADLEVQLNESDLAFLRRVLARSGGELQVVDDELQVVVRARARRGELELDAERDLIRCRVSADLAHQVTAVTVSGWDSAQGERIAVTSDPTDLGPGSGHTGAQVLAGVLRPRSEHLGQLPVRTTTEGQALADAAHQDRARRFVRLDATAPGNPLLRVGTHVRLTGVSARFATTYQVVSACHRFDSVAGYETDFEALSAYLGMAR